jgi:NTP pyrophosphatase (non-canonical NTP hydrolase)
MSTSEITTSTITTTTSIISTTAYNPKTNFEDVCDFNAQFGVKKLDTPCLDDEPFIESKMALIREEMGELEEAVKNKDLIETVDALTDILYVVLGMGYGLNVNLDDAFKIVHESNMSKMCLTEEEAKATVAWYKINQTRYTTPAYRVNSVGNYVVYDEATRKILKSIYYKPADLHNLF